MEERAYKTMLENFKQAAREVFLTKENKKSNDSKKDDGSYKLRSSVLELVDGHVKQNEEYKETTKRKEIADGITGKSMGYKQEVHSEASTRIDAKVDTGFISESTKIQGDIITDSNLMFAGEIIGNIESKNNVAVSGKVYGNITCKDMEINEADIEGNITVLESIKVQKGSRIIGDMSANSAVINGEIEGNVKIKKDVKIYKDARIIGDISASSMYVEDGAVIKGVVNILTEQEEENEM